MKNVSEKWSKKDTINTSASVALQEIAGETINVEAVAIGEDADADGEIKEVGYIKAEDGTIYGTISATALRSIDNIIDLLSDGEAVSVKVVMRKAKSGRDFITLMVI